MSLDIFNLQQFADTIDGSTAPFGLLSRADKNIIDSLGDTYLGISDNAVSASKLLTARSINIRDASSTNTGTAINFDGSYSGTLYLKLPATIKATLTGNADTATRLASATTINGMSFNNSSNIVNFAECSTASNTVVKAVTINSITALTTGTKICIKFLNTNTADNAQLKVNNLTAANILYRGYNVVAGALVANGIYELVYTGSAWELITPLIWTVVEEE